ncbi:hypothetical protein KKF38_03035 [Patescibacteria group bacterium]|nr:hypothetical protein [Patescibacteria group bacterium]
MIKNLFAIVIVSIIFSGCQTIGAVIEDARELQASVSEKIVEIKGGIENTVTEAKDAYGVLLEKKKQLEEMVAEINEAVDSINKLLGRENDPAEIESLRTTIAELQLALGEAERAIGEVEAAEENLENGELDAESGEDLKTTETDGGEVLTGEGAEVAEPAEGENETTVE